MKTVYKGPKVQQMIHSCLLILALMTQTFTGHAQTVLFDFDSIPVHTPFPVNANAGGMVAHLSGTGSSYSIQAANVLGFTPSGFSGNIIYPNSIYLADLLISFDQTISDFSIMYACQELACDDAATMRVTAYLRGGLVGTNTKMTAHPGTWPVDTLRCTFAAFDSVVVHYDHAPLTCRDYGVIYVTDNMRVTQFTTKVSTQEMPLEKLTIPNPVSGPTTFSFTLGQPQHIDINIYDITGRSVKNVFDGYLSAGDHQMHWNGNEGNWAPGLYIVKLSGEYFSLSSKLLLIK